MNARRALLPVLYVTLIVAASAPTQATTFTFDLTGNLADLTNVSYPNDPFVQERLYLTDADTGSSTVPGIVMSTGDTVDINVTLSGGTLTLPAAAAANQVEMLVGVLAGPVFNSDWIANKEQYSIDNLGVAPPTGWITGLGGPEALSVGTGSIGPGLSFSFNTLATSFTLERMYDNGGIDIPQVTLTSIEPYLVLSYPVPTPLPAGLWLLLSGLAGFGVLARRD